MNAKKVIIPGLAAGIIALIVSQVMYMAIAAIFPYDVLKLGGMRAVDDPLMILFFVHYFILGLAIATFYDFAKKSFTGTATQKGITLGIMSWIIYSIPSGFLVFASMNYPIGFTVNSFLGGLVTMLAAGLTITAIAK